MVGKLVAVGWAGWALSVVATVSGYLAPRFGVVPHLAAGLLAAAVLVLALAALLIYHLGMRLVVARPLDGVAAPPSVAAAYRVRADEAIALSIVVLALVAAVFATGIPAYTGRPEGREHGIVFAALVLVGPAILWRLQHVVARGEASLADVDRHVREAA